MRAITFFKHLLIPTKKKIILLVVLLLFLFGGYQYVRSQNSSKDEIKTTKVIKADVKETVSSSGNLTGKDSAVLRFQSGGQLSQLEVKLGDQVEKGQLIAALDTRQLSIALQQARNNLLIRQATAERVEDELKDRKTDETLIEKEERKAAQAARDSAYDAVKEAQRAISNAYLYSPLGGIVVSVLPVVGQNVTGADTIVEVVDDSEIYLNAEVDEADIGKVSIGAKADVTLNSYPDQTFTGTVTQILPTTKTTSTGATVVITKIKLDNQSIQFIANINGQAEIIVKEAKGVLVVPVEALEEDKFIWIKKAENDFEKVEVKTGVISDIDAEIVEGLTEGQEVVTTPSLVKK
jgi:RND family efflux transporter MFP subunit